MEYTGRARSSPLISQQTRHVWRLRALVGAIIGLLNAIIFQIIHTEYPAHFAALVRNATRYLCGEGSLLGIDTHSLVQKALPHSMFATAFVMGFYRGIEFGFVALWLYRNLFPPIDSDVLVPVPEPLAYDPLWGSGQGANRFAVDAALHWAAPAKGPRAEAWNQLRQFVEHGADDGRHTIWRRPRDDNFKDFTWTVLTGGSGSGKSRMAVQFMREELALASRLTGPNRLPVWGRAKISMGEWFRRGWPWARRAPNDPWDVGWIRPGAEDLSREHASRYTVDTTFLNLLERWKPRRPTAFLLDDPLPGDTAKVIGALTQASENYRFPVRLLIVNQSLPDEIPFKQDGPSGKWRTSESRFSGEVIVLGDQTGLSEHEIFCIAQTLPHPLCAWKQLDPRVQEHLKTILEITEGNPMLVELALRRLQRGHAIKDLDAGSLIADRAERILESFDSLPPETKDAALRDLASVTVAGPSSTGPGLVPETSVTFTALRQAMFGRRDAIQRRFSLASHQGLSAVRPERVGDAFVELVLKRCCLDTNARQEVVNTAWELHGTGVLRTLRRVAALHNNLGKAVRVGPPAGVRIDAIEIAIAYAAAVTRSFQDQSWPPELPAALSVACQLLRQLSSEQAREALPRLYALMEADTDIIRIHKREGAICFFNALGRMLEGKLYPSDEASSIALITTAANAVELWRQGDWFGETIETLQADAALEALAKSADASPLPHTASYELARATAWALATFARNSDADSCRQAADRVEVIASTFRGQEPFEAIRCMAKRQVCFAYAGKKDPAGALRYACDIDSIALPFSKAPSIETSRAEAWSYVCYARYILRPDAEDSAATEGKERYLADVREAETKVREIASAFPAIEEFQRRSAKCLEFLCSAQALSGDAPGAKRTAQLVDQLAAPFSSGAFAVCRAVVWKNVSYALRNANSSMDLEDTVSRVDGIAAHFPGRLLVERAKAAAYQSLCNYHCNHLSRAALENAAKTIDRIASGFSADVKLEEIRSDAWSSACYAAALTEDAAAVFALSKMVDTIVDPFEGQANFEVSRAGCVSAQALLAALSTDTEHAQSALQRTTEIALRFPGNEGMVSARLTCYAALAYKGSILGDLQGCEDAVRKADTVASEFPKKSDIQVRRARLWRLVCSSKAKAGDLVGCEYAASEVESILRPFEPTAETRKIIEDSHQYLEQARSNAVTQSKDGPDAPNVAAIEDLPSVSGVLRP